MWQSSAQWRSVTRPELSTLSVRTRKCVGAMVVPGLACPVGSVFDLLRGIHSPVLPKLGSKCSEVSSATGLFLIESVIQVPLNCVD